jgi:hypothetical protein
MLVHEENWISRIRLLKHLPEILDLNEDFGLKTLVETAIFSAEDGRQHINTLRKIRIPVVEQFEFESSVEFERRTLEHIRFAPPVLKVEMRVDKFVKCIRNSRGGSFYGTGRL